MWEMLQMSTPWLEDEADFIKQFIKSGKSYRIE